jgi:hypothetical protein
MCSDELARLRDRLDRGLDEWRDSTPLAILVLGPSMEGPDLVPGARLRAEIYRRCPEYGAAVKGELKELIADAKAKMGAGFDLCLHEMNLASRCDVVIIIPASAGSFAEFGLFALDGEVCAKSLILLDQSYKKKNTFLRQGPAKAYEIRKAIVKRVKYDEVEQVWQLVATELQKRRAAKMGTQRKR